MIATATQRLDRSAAIRRAAEFEEIPHALQGGEEVQLSTRCAILDFTDQNTTFNLDAKSYKDSFNQTYSSNRQTSESGNITVGSSGSSDWIIGAMMVIGLILIAFGAFASLRK